MEKFELRTACSILLCSLLLCQIALEQCSAVDDEGETLLRFKTSIEEDPFGALSNWDGAGAADYCSWFGVVCSQEGHVVALHLGDLGLRGRLSYELSKLIHIKIIDLRNNSFYGTIPREFAALQKLEVLDLRHNDVFTAPSDLGNFLTWKLQNTGDDDDGTFRRQLRSGPDSTAASSSQAGKEAPPHISSSENGSNSPRPTGAQPSAPNSSPATRPTNPNTPEQNTTSPPPTPPSSSPEPSTKVQPPPSSPEPSTNVPSPPGKSKMQHSLKIALPTVASALALLFSVAACIAYFRKKRVDPEKHILLGTVEQQKSFDTDADATPLSRSQIETACEGFSNVIGTLSDCKLYKGTLSTGAEIIVATTFVESDRAWTHEAEDHYRNKVNMLSKIRHKNFMQLIGYCKEEEPFTRMMVVEYAPNGTLFEHLHTKEAEPLDWPTRLRIIMGVIYCLEYIEQISDSITLRNFSSSTIYLTEDYAAKISDIGFSCSEKVANGDIQGSADQESFTYKYGILLLEIISGRLPYTEDNGLLALWASAYLTGQRPLEGMIDPILDSVPEKTLSALCNVAHSCISESIEKRPVVSAVAKLMRHITSISPEAAAPDSSLLRWAELEILCT